MTRLSTLRIGTLTVTDAPLLVPGAEPFLPSPRNAYSCPPDGIIGLNLLRHFAVLLDSGQHTLGLGLPGNLSRQQLAQLGFTQPYTLPIVRKNGMWFAQARFTNEGISGTEDLLIDTGNNGTYISDKLAQTLHLKSVSYRQDKDLYGSGIFNVSSVTSLHLGGLTLLGTYVTVRPVSETELPTLGLDILSGYRVLMDFPGGKLYLQPRPSTIPAITIGPAPTMATPPAK